VESTSDWTFSTPYKGTLRYLSNAASNLRGQTGLELEHLDKESVSTSHLSVVQLQEASIPFDMLSPENPILHFGEVYLFESDLEDCGYMMSKIRFRIMGDCWYVLLRYYLRVDGVSVRCFDTRVFHAFGTDNVHREF
jgi:type 2A phosphatase activator TIP41